jgi:hypothetical protein
VQSDELKISAFNSSLCTLHSALELIITCISSSPRQLAQGDGEVARGTFDAGGVGFEFAGVVGVAGGDAGKRGLDLRIEPLGCGFGFLFSIR